MKCFFNQKFWSLNNNKVFRFENQPRKIFWLKMSLSLLVSEQNKLIKSEEKFHWTFCQTGLGIANHQNGRLKKNQHNFFSISAFYFLQILEFYTSDEDKRHFLRFKGFKTSTTIFHKEKRKKEGKDFFASFLWLVLFLSLWNQLSKAIIGDMMNQICQMFFFPIPLNLHNLGGSNYLSS